ncbi:MAG: hypothetical protein OMM_13710, partial [Candidatus Magnetoglobus multicellularis str. Araruama]
KVIDKSSYLWGQDGYCLQIENDGTLKLQIDGTLSIQYRAKTDPGALQANQWQHIAMTGDGSNYKAYINGISVPLDTKTYVAPPSVDTELRIGKYTGPNRAYNGSIDELNIWNRCLSQTEIQQVMCQRQVGNEDGLLLYYRFDHISGTVVKDLSGNGYHGMLTNMENEDWEPSGASLGYEPLIVFNDAFYTLENQAISGQLNVENIDCSISNFSIVNNPQKGTVHITNTGAFTYTPTLNQYGDDSFSYQVHVNECYDVSNIATVSMFITAVHNPPQAYSQTLRTTENMPVNITLTGFSPENNPLTFYIIDPPSHGILSQSAPYLIYTPNLHFYGTDKFTFFANDSISDSPPETISITIESAKLKIKEISNQEVFISQSDHITITGTGFTEKTRVS